MCLSSVYDDDDDDHRLRMRLRLSLSLSLSLLSKMRLLPMEQSLYVYGLCTVFSSIGGLSCT